MFNAYKFNEAKFNQSDTNNGIQVTVKSDTCRKIAAGVTVCSDTLRKTAVEVTNKHDILRKTAVQETVKADTLRKIKVFDPLTVSGLKQWFDASRVELSDGATVSQWDDVSGNGLHATQSVASYRPTYKSSAVNGRPSLYFDGNNDFLTHSFNSVGADITAFAVLKSTVAKISKAYIANVNVLGQNSSGVWGCCDSSGLLKPSSYSITDGFHAVGARWDKANSQLSLLTDQNAAETIISSYGTGTSGAYGIAGYTASTANFAGYIAEIIVYNRALTDTEFSQVQNYLYKKYFAAVVANVSIKADTLRKTAVQTVTKHDTLRHIGGSVDVVIKHDTLRKIGGSINVSVKHDILRKTALQVSNKHDILRKKKAVVAVKGDVLRKSALPVVIKADSKRKVAQLLLNAVNLWGLAGNIKLDFAVESISVGIDRGQISEKYTATLYTPAAMYQYFNCQVGDFPCSFQIRDIKNNPVGAKTITARQDLDEWMYNTVAFVFNPTAAHAANGYVGQAVEVKTTMPYASTVMAALGIQGNYDDFTATNIGLQANKYLSNGVVVDATTTIITTNADGGSTTTTGGNTDKYTDGGQDVTVWGMTDYKTKKQLVTSLFSWSDGLPTLRHLVTFRNGQPYVYQRNKLPLVSNLDDASKWVVDLKEHDSEVIKTIYGNSNYSIVDNNANNGNSGIQDPGDLKNGIYSYGNSSIVYSNGLKTSETKNGKTTNYSYVCVGSQYANDSEAATELNVIYGHRDVVLSREESDDNITHYYYDEFDGVTTLHRKVGYNPNEGTVYVTDDSISFPDKKFDVKVTDYTPAHNGAWNIDEQIYDGDTWTTLSKGVTEGSPGGQATIYRAEADFTRTGNTAQIYSNDSNVQLEGQPCGDVPTAPDYATACLIATEWNWLNNKIHYTATLEVFNKYGNNHVIDKIEKVKYMGLEWFVVNNNIVVKPSRVSQTLELETWLSETESATLETAFEAVWEAKLRAGVS